LSVGARSTKAAQRGQRQPQIVSQTAHSYGAPGCTSRILFSYVQAAQATRSARVVLRAGGRAPP
jgi:hypothetical protein